MKQWVDNHYSRNLRLPEIHVFDRDTNAPPKYQGAIDTVNARGDGSWGALTSKRELENYYHPDAIQEVFGVTIAFADTDDVPTILSAAVNAEAINPYKTLGASRAKRVLSELATPKMTIARINAIDPANEIEGWLGQIAVRLS